MTRVKRKREIEDGFGSSWPLCHANECGLEVVRPGKVQCWCDGLGMSVADVEVLAGVCGAPVADVAFIAKTAEQRMRERERALLVGNEQKEPRA